MMDSFLRSHNPVLTSSTFQTEAATEGQVFTIRGAALKTFFLLGLVFANGAVTWWIVINEYFSAILWVMLGAVLIGVATAVTIGLTGRWAPYLASAYAILQGLFLGAVSAFFESLFPGVFIQAILLTGGILCALLALHMAGLKMVKTGDPSMTRQIAPLLRAGPIIALLGIALAYLVTFVLRSLGVPIVYLHQTGWFGILFSLFMIAWATFNLLLDFELIERANRQGAPEEMEWIAGFGLTGNLAWLYFDILRLIPRLGSGKSSSADG